MLIMVLLGCALQLLRPCLLHRDRLQDREEGIAHCLNTEGAAVHHGSTLTCRVQDMLPNRSLHTGM